jgi:hypothetical protein
VNKLKYVDWFTYFGGVFAGTVLANSLQDLDIEIKDTPWLARLIILSVITMIPLVIMLRRIRAGKSINSWDERINMISVKSARNALFLTYGAIFIHQLIIESTSLDTMWVLIILASGLIGYYISMLFYSYIKV